MKKILLILITFIGATIHLGAQTLTLSDDHGDQIPNGSNYQINEDQSIVFIHVTNTSANTVNARSKKIEHFLATGDGISLCWGGQCQSPDQFIVPPIADAAVEILAGVTDEGFDILYTCGGSGTATQATLVFYYEEDPNDSTYININFGPEAVNEIATIGTISGAYPNPASNYTQIDIDVKGNNNAMLVFYNVLGEEIFKQKINKNKETIQLNTLNWANGIYYYSLLNNSQNLSTKKLIINH